MTIHLARWLAALFTGLGLILLVLAIALLVRGAPAGGWPVLASA